MAAPCDGLPDVLVRRAGLGKGEEERLAYPRRAGDAHPWCRSSASLLWLSDGRDGTLGRMPLPLQHHAPMRTDCRGYSSHTLWRLWRANGSPVRWCASARTTTSLVRCVEYCSIARLALSRRARGRTVQAYQFSLPAHSRRAWCLRGCSAAARSARFRHPMKDPPRHPADCVMTAAADAGSVRRITLDAPHRRCICHGAGVWKAHRTRGRPGHVTSPLLQHDAFLRAGNEQCGMRCGPVLCRGAGRAALACRAVPCRDAPVGALRDGRRRSRAPSVAAPRHAAVLRRCERAEGAGSVIAATERCMARCCIIADRRRLPARGPHHGTMNTAPSWRPTNAAVSGGTRPAHRRDGQNVHGVAACEMAPVGSGDDRARCARHRRMLATLVAGRTQPFAGICTIDSASSHRWRTTTAACDVEEAFPKCEWRATAVHDVVSGTAHQPTMPLTLISCCCCCRRRRRRCRRRRNRRRRDRSRHRCDRNRRRRCRDRRRRHRNRRCRPWRALERRRSSSLW